MKPMGSITALPSGRFRLRIGAGRESFVFETEAEATEQQAAMTRILSAQQEEETVGFVVRRWLNDRQRQGTIVDIRRDIRRFENHIEPHDIAKRALRGLTHAECFRWWQDLQTKLKRSPANNVRHLLAGALQHEHDMGRIRVNPMHGLKARRGTDSEEAWTFLTLDEQRAFLKRCTEVEAIMIELLWLIGFRAGEFVSIRLKDVDMRAGKIAIRYGGKFRETTKAKKVRRISMFDRVKVLLKRWLEILPDYCPHNPHGLLFPRPGGGFRASERVVGSWPQWAGLVEPIGRRFRQHDLRHTCASALISGMWGPPWSLEKVRDYLGHEDIKVTQRYAHLAPDALEADIRATHRGGGGGDEVSGTRKDTVEKLERILNSYEAGTGVDSPQLHSGFLGKNGPRVLDVSTWAWAVTKALASGNFVEAEKLIGELREVLASDHRQRFALELALAVIGDAGASRKAGAR